MKSSTRLLLFLFLFQGWSLFSQEIPEYLKRRDEIYFTFRMHDRSEIGKLTRMISIDNLEGMTVHAYANMKEFVAFQKLGYEVTLLPPPGDGPGVEMWDPETDAPLTTWNYYPTYSGYETLMAQFQTNYPSLCNLDTLTTLASGRRLLMLKISDNVNTDEAEPEFLYTSSIHGDETTGYILMMHLADYLLSNYGTNTEVTDLVNNMEIYICPLANPDGTYYGGNSSVSGARRANINGVDLNRNYPDFQDGQHPDGNSWQPETQAFMTFASQHHFTAGCNFHGGVEVVNYPWDTWATLHPDDSWYQYISREYADTVHLHATSSYMTYLNNGITNGYAWYEVNGGRQDYMNYYHHCRELTIELSGTKILPAANLLAYWDYNWRSFILLMKEARYGIHGTITDQQTGAPVAAKVFITSHDNYGSEVYASANLGDYHRPLKAGTYTLEVSAPCYQTQTITGVTVADHATLTLNIQMVPGPAASVTTTAASSITTTGAATGGTVTCTGNTPVTARGVCWGTTTGPLVTGNHTTNGSGAGTFTSQITGLSANTLYYLRAYATNSSGTYYGTELSFTTACGTVSLPFSESFSGTTLPSCWSQIDHIGNGQIWLFGTITGQSPNPTLTGNYAYLNSDAYSSGNSQNVDLVTPTLDLSPFSTVTLGFKHYFKSYTGSSGTVSYSINNGTTWTTLLTYTTTSASNPAIVSQAVSAVAGQSQVKFKWNYTGTYAYYWAVDEVSITGNCTANPVSVTISCPSVSVCPGTSVTYTAVPANGGTSPAYQWKVNAASVTNATNATYTYVPSNGDQVTCVLTSNVSCPSGNPATSNTLTMSVAAQPVSVSISASSNPVCQGTAVTFTAILVNGGTTPAYQWKVNAANAANATNATYSYTPANGDQVTCVLTSSLACPTGNPATSNTLSMSVGAQPVSVSITASANPVCQGTTVSFTATPANGGTTPAYQWKVNASNASNATNATFSYVPANGDQVTCVLTSNISCPSGNPATSNTVTLSVNPMVTAGVSISVSANPVCRGSSVTFTADPVNGGITPAYQWKVNAVNAGNASNATFSYVPANGDQVTCVMTSAASCVAGSPATSNAVSMTVTPPQNTPAVTIAASSNPSCEGVPVDFTAVPVNGGTAPVYVWKVNSIGAPASTNNVFSFTPQDGDEVQCFMTSNAACITAPSAGSNSISLTVSPVLPVLVFISASVNPVTTGTPVTFSATGVNGGAMPHFQWRINALNASQASNATYTYIPDDGDRVSCRMTSSDACVSGNPAFSDSITMIVAPVPAALSIQGITLAGTDCYDAIQTISVAGEGTSFTVVAGGDATFVAGKNILFYPGTAVFSGGYLSGQISPSGPWCSPESRSPRVTSNLTAVFTTGSIRVYPNPTTDLVTVENDEKMKSGYVRAEVLNMQGIRVFSRVVEEGSGFTFGLEEYPSGIYLVKVSTQTGVSCTRIILRK